MLWGQWDNHKQPGVMEVWIIVIKQYIYTQKKKEQLNYINTKMRKGMEIKNGNFSSQCLSAEHAECN